MTSGQSTRGGTRSMLSGRRMTCLRLQATRVSSWGKKKEVTTVNSDVASLSVSVERGRPIRR